ncbi:hypothetical protein IW261DRAFT_1517764 [Armillaria novae-zelandiae]|uniref:Secreted protein n=1 Tax=Armillaria novae-zelandiae TaxID=153914 RepID=A0AA39NN95_9AGAR|nr:hypothetical protein IW261DRAFT_1517764 [Armillaria novae-zelandiae]
MKGILIFPFLASWVGDFGVVPASRGTRSVRMVFRCVFRVGEKKQDGAPSTTNNLRCHLLCSLHRSTTKLRSLRAFSICTTSAHCFLQFDSHSPSGTCTPPKSPPSQIQMLKKNKFRV